MNFEINIPVVIVGFLNFLIIYFIFHIKNKRPILRVLTPDLGQWMDIEKNPIPEEFKYKELILTDGNIVRTTYLRYNGRGRAVLGYNESETEVIFWRPMPLPPRLNDQYNFH